MSEHLGWLITRRGWERMATRPEPFYAHTEAEKDWFLRNTTRPDLYDVTRVPDPLTPEQRAEHDRFVWGDTVTPP